MELTIIIPLYNKQDSINITIDSILSQDFRDYEIVVVDDGSTDSSVDIVKSIADERIFIYQKRNGGPASARNYGVKKARGEWILFLDADDTLEKNALVLASQNIKKHSFVDVFSYSQYMAIDNIKWIPKANHTNGYIFFPFFNYYLSRIYPGPGRMIVKRDILLKESFREDIKRHEDTELVFRLMRKYRFYASSFPLFTYHLGTLSASGRCEKIKDDFVCNMQPQGKSFFEKMVMYKLYINETCKLYPDFAKSIYGNYFDRWSFKLCDKIYRILADLKKDVTSLIHSKKDAS